MIKFDMKETASYIENILKSGCEKIIFDEKMQLDIKEKGKADIVTAKDIAMENYIIEKIKAKFPDHKIIGEEGNYAELTNDYTWIIDPIDGTLNFTVGNPFYGTQMCLLKNKNEILSAVYLPAFDEFYLAIKNMGAYLNGNRITTDKTISEENAIVSFGDFSKSNPSSRKIQLSLIDVLHNKVNKIRLQGSSSIDFSFVSSGKTHAHVMFSKRLWEISPGILLAKEAGAVAKIVSVNNNDFKGNVVVIAANKNIFDLIINNF